MKKISLMKSKKYVTYVKKKFCLDENEDDYDKDEDDENFKKVKDHCHYTETFRGAAHSICNLRQKVPKNIPIVIHNASYDTQSIINQLAKQFKGEIDCIGENMEKYIIFSVTIKKNVMTVKQLHANLSLLIVLDLCQLHHQILLITYLKLTKMNVKHARKEECEFIKHENNNSYFKYKKCQKIWLQPS